MKKFLSIFAAIVLTASLASAAGVNYGNTAVVDTNVSLIASAGTATNAYATPITSGSTTNGSWNTPVTAGSVVDTRLEVVIYNMSSTNATVYAGKASTSNLVSTNYPVAVIAPNGGTFTIRYPFLDKTEYGILSGSQVAGSYPFIGHEFWGRIQ